MSLIKKGLSDSKYYLIANIGNKLLAFLIIPILAKSISIEEFATYDLFLVITAFLNIFIILGIDSGIGILLSESQNSDKQLSFLYVSSILISFFALSLISTILFFIFLYVDRLFLLNGEIWIYICLYILFNMISYHTFSFLRWREKAKEASFITLFSYISGMLIGVYFLYLDKSVESYLQGLIIGLSLGSILSLYLSKEYIFKFQILDNSKVLLKELFILSLPYVPNSLGSSLMQMVDRVVIVMLFGMYELGLYALIMKIAKIPKIIIDTLSGGFFPIMFKSYKSEQGKKLIRNFFHIYLISIPIFFLIAYSMSDWIVKIFAGNKYIDVSYMFPMALVSILFIGGTKLNGLGYSIKRKTHYILYITFSAIVLNYIFSLLFGYFMGLEGVIVGTLTAGILKIYFYTLQSEKLYRFGYSFKLILFISLLSFILVLSCL
ncbi:polysaccharide biosynthesis protein [hydrothermal vent metagenome]|uniref:Polysaccharide biosynthesis protein n=1 Tax=hydrothermal vent metagenome TaxID=652676 RepID=A0A1W1CXS9_9ZZZZ